MELFMNVYIKLEKVLSSKNVHKNLFSSIELEKLRFIKIKIYIIDSFDREKTWLKLWNENKNNLCTFLSSKPDQFPIKTQNFIFNKTTGNDIIHIKKLDDRSIEIYHKI